MRKIVLLNHVSLDGFMAGNYGEMDLIQFDEEVADYVGQITAHADTAVYGRKTFQMMESYWPTAAESPNASKHEVEHGAWVNKALKIVFSKSLKTSGWRNTKIISGDVAEEISALVKQPGKNILLIGSASISHIFMQHDLIDEFWINVNPVLVGSGLPLFSKIPGMLKLKLVRSTAFKCGVIGLQYVRERNEE
jgi:dihydrofolate reductase